MMCKDSCALQMKGYLTAKELTRIERVHPAAVMRWIGHNLLASARLVGKEWRVSVAEYEQWRDRDGNKLLRYFERH